jgi:hypothetical protein
MLWLGPRANVYSWVPSGLSIAPWIPIELRMCSVPQGVIREKGEAVAPNVKAFCVLARASGCGIADRLGSGLSEGSGKHRWYH